MKRISEFTFPEDSQDSSFQELLKENPNLFPVYLFLFFAEKLARESEVPKKWREDLLGLNVVTVRCHKSGLLATGYGAGICLSHITETSTRFSLLIGKEPFH